LKSIVRQKFAFATLAKKTTFWSLEFLAVLEGLTLRPSLIGHIQFKEDAFDEEGLSTYY